MLYRYRGQRVNMCLQRREPGNEATCIFVSVLKSTVLYFPCQLKELLNTAHEQTSKCRAQNKTLQSQLENSKRREQKLRDEILALRGRLTCCRKAHEQLQTHCSVLEKEVESRVKEVSTIQARRSRKESRLAKECRKKVKSHFKFTKYFDI